MTLINELKAAGRLSLLLNYRSGSLLDTSPSPLAAPTNSNSPVWMKTNRGYGVHSNYNTGAVTNYGVSTKLNFGATGSVWGAWVPTALSSVSAYAQWFSKGTPPLVSGLNGFWLYRNNTNLLFQLADGSGAQTTTLALTNLAVGQPVFLTYVWNGTNVFGYLNGNQFVINSQTRTPTPTGASLYVGDYSTNATYESLAACLTLGMSSSVLSSTEVARLYEDWLQDSFITDLPRRNFVFMPQQGFNDATEVSKNIVLDTDFQSIMDGATRKVRDLGPNNYIGAITGTITPGQNGEGLALNVAASDEINNGDITQLNSAASFTYETWFETPSGNIPASYIALKYKDSNNNIRIGCLGGSASPKQLVFSVFNAGAGYSNTTATQIRGGTKQHITCVFNGSGATNADKSQIYIDGESAALTFATDFPATSSNLAGFGFYHALGAGQLGTRFGERIFSTALTAAQVRQEYVNNFARKLLLKETFEDVPVSLVASYGAGTYFGSWQLDAGTAKISETADGKRWIECVTGCIFSMPQPNAFGTIVIPPIIKAAISTSLAIGFMMAQRGNRFAAGVNGYLFYYQANTDKFVLDRWTNGAGALDLLYTASGYTTDGVAYQYAINRRPSDGRFTAWIKGGAYTNWTLIDATGGGGSNPTAAESTYTANGWAVITLAAGDKVCFYDPNDSRIGLQVYQGALNPWELP